VPLEELVDPPDELPLDAPLLPDEPPPDELLLLDAPPDDVPPLVPPLEELVLMTTGPDPPSETHAMPRATRMDEARKKRAFIGQSRLSPHPEHGSSASRNVRAEPLFYGD
jgi:hypothetical protein